MARRGYSPVTPRWLNQVMRRAHATRTRAADGTLTYSAPFVLSLAWARNPVLFLNALNLGDQEQVRSQLYTAWVLQVNEDGTLWKFHDLGPPRLRRVVLHVAADAVGDDPRLREGQRVAVLDPL